MLIKRYSSSFFHNLVEFVITERVDLFLIIEEYENNRD